MSDELIHLTPAALDSMLDNARRDPTPPSPTQHPGQADRDFDKLFLAWRDEHNRAIAAEHARDAFLADLDAVRQDAEKREQLLDRNAAGWHQALRDLDAAREALRRVEQERDAARGQLRLLVVAIRTMADVQRMPEHERGFALVAAVNTINEITGRVDTAETQEGTG